MHGPGGRPAAGATGRCQALPRAGHLQARAACGSHRPGRCVAGSRTNALMRPDSDRLSSTIIRSYFSLPNFQITRICSARLGVTPDACLPGHAAGCRTAPSAAATGLPPASASLRPPPRPGGGLGCAIDCWPYERPRLLHSESGRA